MDHLNSNMPFELFDRTPSKVVPSLTKTYRTSAGHEAPRVMSPTHRRSPSPRSQRRQSQEPLTPPVTARVYESNDTQDDAAGSVARGSHENGSISQRVIDLESERSMLIARLEQQERELRAASSARKASPALDRINAAARSAAVTPTDDASLPETDSTFGWSVSDWVASLGGISTEIATALVRPVHDLAPGSAAAQLDFLCRMARAPQGVQDFAALLSDSGLVNALAQHLYDAAKKLATAPAATGEGLNAKFIEEGSASFTMAFGGLDRFHSGLEGLIGPPHPNLLHAMLSEHCAHTDSHRWFRTSNYEVHTTSEIEWHFVYDPEEALPLLSDEHGKPLEDFPVEGTLRAPSVIHKSRTALPLSAFEDSRRDIRGKLQAVDSSNLLDEEFIGARLYTGPGACTPRTREAPCLIGLLHGHLCVGSPAAVGSELQSLSSTTSYCAPRAPNSFRRDWTSSVTRIAIRRRSMRSTRRSSS